MATTQAKQAKEPPPRFTRCARCPVTLVFAESRATGFCVSCREFFGRLEAQRRRVYQNSRGAPTEALSRAESLKVADVREGR